MPESFPRRKISDAELEHLVGELIDHDEPLPDGLGDAANALFGLRGLDQELAVLVDDSDERLTLGVRDAGQRERVVVFATDRHTIELVMAEDAVLGQIVPAVEGAVQVSDCTGTVRELPLDSGRFRLEGRPAGPLRVAFAINASRVTTPWMTMGPSHPAP